MTEFSKPYYTLTEAAKILSVHRNTLRNMVNDGRLPCFRAGRIIRVPAEALAQLQQAAKTAAEERAEVNAIIASVPEEKLAEIRAAIEKVAAEG